MRGKVFRHVFAVWAAGLLCGAGLLAQESSGNIYGRVLDEQAAPIAGASATLTGPAAPQTTESDGTGRFRFLGVDPGRYTVTITHPRFATTTYENVVVTLGKNTDFTANLKLSGVQETITVSSATPLLDTRKVQTGSHVLPRGADGDPDGPRHLCPDAAGPRASSSTRSTSAGNASGRAGGPDFSTKGSGGVTYRVDGATITDNSYGAFNGGQARQNGGANIVSSTSRLSTRWTSQRAARSSTFRRPGATINVVTKRGTNEIKGSARFLYASGRLAVETTTSDEAVEQELRDQQHAFHPRVRRRDRRSDRQGPAVALGLRFAAGHLAESHRQRTPRATRSAPSTARALDREAERPDLGVELRYPLLPAERPFRGNTGARIGPRAPETRAKLIDRYQLLQGRGQPRLLAQPLRLGDLLATYQDATLRRRPARGTREHPGRSGTSTASTTTAVTTT